MNASALRGMDVTTRRGTAYESAPYPNEMTAAVWQFKRAFLAHHLSIGESISATAKRLGIQRTYLTRLKRDLGLEGLRPRIGPHSPASLLAMQSGVGRADETAHADTPQGGS